MSLEAKAKAFATEKHAGQTRKYTGEPYIVHPAAVVELVRSVPHTEEMLAAAWLHDVVEDCGIQIERLYLRFGAQVARMVEMLTDVSKPYMGSRAARKKLDREHTALAWPEAKTIKLADLIHNTSTIVPYDPKFARTYLEEKRLLLEVLREGDPVLYRKAYEMAHQPVLVAIA